MTTKRHRVGVEEDGAEDALAADVLVDEHGEQEAEDQAAREMNSTPKMTMFSAEIEEARRCSNRRWYCARPTKSSFGSSFELVKDSRTVQSMQPR